MRKRVEHKRNSGFSLVETLAAVAILVILLSLSAVAVAYYRDYLTITELDNAAREIYMAAENRAVLLDGGSQLEPALPADRVVTLSASLEGGIPAGTEARYISETDTDVLEELLPAGTVDPALLDGHFYIVYEPASGSVTDVFYSEKPGIPSIDDAFAWARQGRDYRMKQTPMLGYYGGGLVEKEEYLPLPAPEVIVNIRNEDRLLVEVTFKIPENARDLVGPANLENATKRTVKLQYQDKEIVLFDNSTAPAVSPYLSSGRLTTKGALSNSSFGLTYTWVLDALDEGKDWRFSQLSSTLGDAYGGDFTVTADVTLDDGVHKPSSASGSDTDNSLFAEFSDGAIARVENLRHLQNLDSDFSHVKGKDSAVQLADISCYDNGTYPQYCFRPIVNSELLSFDGGRNASGGRNRILNLRVTEESAQGKPAAGLFATTPGGTSAEPVTLTGVRLIGASVTCAKPAGGLVGSAGAHNMFTDIEVQDSEISGSTAGGGVVGRVVNQDLSGNWAAPFAYKTFENIRVINTSVICAGGDAGGVAGRLTGLYYTGDFADCRVYWVPEEGQNNLRSLLTDGQADDSYKYVIQGAYAGGLVGELFGSGGTNISESFSATTIRGTITAGGLVGRSTNLGVQNSYADCYLTGKSAAGLVGDTMQFDPVNCYAAGFIVMGPGDTAAGLALGSDSKITTDNVYSVMSFPGQDPNTNRVYELTELQANDNQDYFTNTYYLGSEGEKIGGPSRPEDQKAMGKSYLSMTSPAFVANMGGEFVEVGSDSYPYNLQTKRILNIYEFPGLKDLPHYGDWVAEFKQPSLVYYEQYANGQSAFSGGNVRYVDHEEFGELNAWQVHSDGYAVAILKEDLPASGSFSITYTYLDTSGGSSQKKTLPRSYPDEAALIETTWEGKTYILAPLPQELVEGDLTSPDFFQYLQFAFDQKLKDFQSAECFYSPHFAETVIPYAAKNGEALADWSRPAADVIGRITDYAANLIAQPSNRVANIRTPRHLASLSKYQDYYNNRHNLSFQQVLDLDGAVGSYGGGSGGLTLAPIGSKSAPFLGSYDGGCNTIQHIAFQIPEGGDSGSRVCAGLFGYSNGTLENIVYQLDPEKELSITIPSTETRTYLGALVGVNNAGTLRNCAVEGANLSSRVFDSSIYIGGLVGLNDGMIEDCSADSALLSGDASNYGHAYIGGLVGWNSKGQISTSYAMGRISAKAEERTSDAQACGFAGWNSNSIRYSYAAMDLQADGAGAQVFSFCGKTEAGGRQVGTSYLNKGNFTYRGESFLADYEAAAGGAVPRRYTELTAGDAVSGMSLPAGANASPYPSAVKDVDGNICHHGSWPEPMDLGEMGVYYWEELEIGGKTTYHITALAANPTQKTVAQESTLSSARDDGGVVTRYGYGFYSKTGITVSVKSQRLLSSVGSNGTAGAGQEFQNALRGLESAKESAAENTPAYLDRQVDEQLELLTDGFKFHSFHSFGLDQGLGGLYPDSTAQIPNSTLTLEQYGREDAQVTFTLNPFFAGALSVEYPSGWGPKPGGKPENIPFVTGANSPGSAGNPYGVRSIEQLELINWNRINRNARTVVELRATGAKGIANFPYLSSTSTTTQYFWKQSHDLKGVDGQTYYPIAEFYDNTTSDANRGYLDGWFGGVYDGDSYIIENVDIQGQLASCAGLFGVVYNGTLKNIVLYSSSGTSTVSGGFYDGGTSAPGEPPRAPQSVSQWYAIGALAGVAASHNKDGSTGGSAVQNCTVSGYTINSHTYTRLSNGGKAWGGTGVGGLLGLSNMALESCTADADIKLVSGSIAHDNMRIGGLVGSCQGSISRCYAGGTITVDPGVQVDKDSNGNYTCGIYIGALVGGTYMKPLQVGTSSGSNLTIGYENDGGGLTLTSNELIDCYSYVRLPSLTAHPAIKGLFAVGGAGEILASGGSAVNHGVSTKRNCYYLQQEVLSLNGGTGESILNAGIKTDLGDESYVVGEEYIGYGQGGFTQVIDRNSRVTAIRNEAGNSLSLDNVGDAYYKSGSTVADGLPVFQYTRRSDSNGRWIYKFLGWLVNYNAANTTWTLTADSTRFSSITGVTYEQLAGEPIENDTNNLHLISGKTIYQLLNRFDGSDEDARKAGPFKPVTTETAEGIPVPGKYSYPPATSGELQGQNYPFPTILTRERGAFCVHYGKWPSNGIQRVDQNGTPLGSAPITLDLFVSSSYTEWLVLTERIPDGGKWTWDSEDTSVAAVDGQITQDAGMGAKTYALHIVSRSPGTAVLKISYAVNGIVYSQSITVHVTDDVELSPHRMFLFPNDRVTVEMKAGNKEGTLLSGGTLELLGDPSCGGDGVQVQTVKPEAEGEKPVRVRFLTEDAPSNLTVMAGIRFQYAAAGSADAPKEYDSPVQIEVLELPEPKFEIIEEPAGDSGGGQKTRCTILFEDFPVQGGAAADTLKFQVSGVTLNDASGLGAAAPAVEWEQDGNGNGTGNAITLTYPSEETPEVTLTVTLSMTSEQGLLIGEAQSHELTLTVQKPADAPVGTRSAPQLPDALSPAGDAAGQSGTEKALEAPDPAAPDPVPIADT